jgi:hypothetical protein
MPQDHQITCIIPDGADADRRIDSIGGATGSKNLIQNYSNDFSFLRDVV